MHNQTQTLRMAIRRAFNTFCNVLKHEVIHIYNEAFFYTNSSVIN